MSDTFTFSGLPEAAATNALSQGFEAAKAALTVIGGADALVFVGYLRPIGDGTADFKLATPAATHAGLLSMIATAILQSARDRVRAGCDCSTCAAIHAALAPLEALQAQAQAPVRPQ